jgi:hypothetical protein
MSRAYNALWYAEITMLSRRALLLATMTAALGRPLARVGGARATPTALLVEDWSQATLGAHGVPPGWEKYETPRGHPPTTSVVEDEAAAPSRCGA